MAFFHGGAKFHAATTHTKAELEQMIEEAYTSNIGFVKIDTTNEDESIADDSLTLLFSRLLFYTVLEKNTSQIVRVPGAGGLAIQ